MVFEYGNDGLAKYLSGYAYHKDPHTHRNAIQNPDQSGMPVDFSKERKNFHLTIC